MATRYGGPLPDTKYGFEITVEPPAAVDADPLDQWEVVRISGVAADGSGYKAAAAVAGDTSDAVLLGLAKHYCNDSDMPLGLKVLGLGAPTVLRVPTTGAPTLGQSIAVSAADVRKFVGVAFSITSRSKIMKVLTGEVEVLVW